MFVYGKLGHPSRGSLKQHLAYRSMKVLKILVFHRCAPPWRWAIWQQKYTNLRRLGGLVLHQDINSQALTICGGASSLLEHLCTLVKMCRNTQLQCSWTLTPFNVAREGRPTGLMTSIPSTGIKGDDTVYLRTNHSDEGYKDCLRRKGRPTSRWERTNDATSANVKQKGAMCNLQHRPGNMCKLIFHQWKHLC